MRKKPYTPNTIIRSALRRLWLRSRERAKALKDAEYRCAKCGIKQSKAKGKEVYVEVHHIDEIDWNSLFDEIRKRLLHPPERQQCLCVDCHKKENK